MPLPENDPVANVYLIQEAPTYQLRQRADKDRRMAEVQEVMDQYYRENPGLESQKRQARIEALGWKVLSGEVSLQENNPR